MQSISSRDPKVRSSKYLHEISNHEIPFELECIHDKEKILDGFTLQYNSLMYMLQIVCGFKVRVFVIYEEDLKDKKLLFLINLSFENRLRLATKYEMKKEIDYSVVDFFINEPFSPDQRPLKLHSSFTQDKSMKEMQQVFKKISRHFKVFDPQIGS